MSLVVLNMVGWPNIVFRCQASRTRRPRCSQDRPRLISPTRCCTWVSIYKGDISSRSSRYVRVFATAKEGKVLCWSGCSTCRVSRIWRNKSMPGDYDTESCAMHCKVRCCQHLRETFTPVRSGRSRDRWDPGLHFHHFVQVARGDSGRDPCQDLCGSIRCSR